MNASMQTIHPLMRPGGLGASLIQHGLTDEVSIETAINDAQTNGRSIITQLISDGIVTSRQLAEIASTEYGLPLYNLKSYDSSHIPDGALSEQFILENNVFPLWKRGKRLFVATSDPTQPAVIDKVRFKTGLMVDAVLVEDDQLAELIAKFSQDGNQAIDDLLGEDLENFDLDIDDGIDDIPDDQSEGVGIDDAPVVKYVNKILLDAIKSGASDIHFEPYEKKYRVRLRIDGMLHEKSHPPANIAPRVSARLKVMSRMNIAERRVPQDGRIKLVLSKNRAIDFRVNTCPTLYGEKVVLRVLDASAAQIGVEALGINPEQQRLFTKAIEKPYGMILVTGPTGSGKTVTLYTALNHLNKPEVNISTAEDPVEIQVAGINQVNVNPKTGLTFAEALRAFLRQDPDIVMVGEIRDLETAEIGVKAAQTGHLVLSTLHTNNAAQTLSRLSNMGVPAFNIASSVNLILAQRLARKLCDHCKEPSEFAHDALLEEGFSHDDLQKKFTVYKAKGCPKCTNGYKGRIGLFELMPVSEEMGRVLLSGANAMEIQAQADKEGFSDLRASGLAKVKAGLTSLEEINRVTKD
jgi:type IV pilus assembly protein PilB